MTTQQFRESIESVVTRAEADGDEVMAVYFSVEEDKFIGVHTEMDGGDALIIIRYLMDEYEISGIGLLTSDEHELLDREV